MTTQVKTHTIALIEGPLNGHIKGAHCCRTIDRIDEQGLPERITATPAGMFFDMEIPDSIGRYVRRVEERVDDTVQPDAVYRWVPGR